MSESKSNSVTKKEDQEKKQSGGQCFYLRKQDDTKKSTDGIPVLRYGKGNNFHKFKHALSEVALKEFGNLGKLINLGKYYVPQINQASLYDAIRETTKGARARDVEGIQQASGESPKVIRINQAAHEFGKQR